MGGIVLRLPWVAARLLGAAAACWWRARRAEAACRAALRGMGLPPEAVERLSRAYGPPQWLLRPWLLAGVRGPDGVRTLRVSGAERGGSVGAGTPP
jgi:hypothetical protein